MFSVSSAFQFPAVGDFCPGALVQPPSGWCLASHTSTERAWKPNAVGVHPWM